MTASKIFFIFLGLICFSAIETRRHRFHKHRALRHDERELKRTKRHLDAELEKIFTRIQVSPIQHSKRSKRSSYRPYVAGQVQDVRIEIKLKAYWKDELANRYTPQFRLLAGNVVDEISNALIDNRNFLEANVLRFRPSKWNILADVSMKFFKTEVDPLHYIEGIVASGWISGLQVFKNYFKVIKIVNGNVNFPAWNYPKGLRLRLHPAVLTKVNAVKKVKHKVVLPANYKEIKVSFQLYQRWNTLFLATFSSPYRLLSGNIEQSLDDVFGGSPNYLNSQVLGFRESSQGQTIVDMYVRFANAEVYPAQKLKILISSGNVGDTPVISDSLEIYEINNVTSDQPIQEPSPSDEFPKPHSEAEVNQSLNDTETEKNKVKQETPLQETTEPIYPLAEPNKEKSAKLAPNQSAIAQSAPVASSASSVPSDEATMSLKLQRLKFSKQIGYVVMEHQQVNPLASEKPLATDKPLATEKPLATDKPLPTEKPLVSEVKQVKPVLGLKDHMTSSVNNVIAETAEPIYPKQTKISDSVIPSSYQQQQQQSQQQQLTSLQSPQQQNLLSQGQVTQQQAYQPISQQQQLPIPGGSQQNSPNKETNSLEGNLWHDLPEQVEGKLVMNQEKPVSPNLSKEIEKGNEKQLAQQPPNANQTTDGELEKLQKNIAEQQSATNIYSSADTGSQGTDDNFTDSSDTPTLGKILYPQLSAPKEPSKGYDASKANSTEENAALKKPQSQEVFLQAAENFLSDKQDNQNGTHSTQAEAEAKENAEEQKAVATMVAGVVSQRIQHFKASQMQVTYSPSANSSVRNNNVISESNRNQTKPQQATRPSTDYHYGGDVISQARVDNQPDQFARVPNSRLETSSPGKTLANFSEIQSPQGSAAAENWNAKTPGTQQTNSERIQILNNMKGNTSYFQQQQQNAYQQPQQQNAYQQPQQQNAYQQPQQQNAYQQPQQQNAYQQEKSPAISFSTNATSPNYAYSSSENSAQEQKPPKNATLYTASSYSSQENIPEPSWPLATPSKSALSKPSVQLNIQQSEQVNYEPTPLIVTSKDSSNENSSDKTFRVHLKPHIYTPKVQLYKWPPVALPVEVKEAPPQLQPEAITGNQIITTSSQHALHGKMTLQQTWHPLLDNENSLPYKVLKEHIQHSIEETYSSHHLNVICKVTGLSKTPRKTTHAITMEKVGVNFDLLYVNNEGEVVKTMKQVAKNGVIAELLVYPDSVSVADEESPYTLSPAKMQEKPDRATSSATDQNIVATSPMPLGNTTQISQENVTKANNFSTPTPTTKAPAMTTKPAEPSFEFVTAPKDIPKSCEQIRDYGIGKSDGQYVLEARKGCHLSVICQNMEDKHPKEFLGGPNKSEWEAYPFAALIKISSHDKENIQSGACLENSDEGRKLLEQIYRAKGKQNLPTPPWKTNIKRLLEGRKRREIKKILTVILAADPGKQKRNKANERYPRSSGREGEDWGVL